MVLTEIKEVGCKKALKLIKSRLLLDGRLSTELRVFALDIFWSLHYPTISFHASKVLKQAINNSCSEELHILRGSNNKYLEPVAQVQIKETSHNVPEALPWSDLSIQ